MKLKRFYRGYSVFESNTHAGDFLVYKASQFFFYARSMAEACARIDELVDPDPLAGCCGYEP